MPTLTKKQKQIYDYIEKYIKRKEYSPTFEEIKGHFGYATLSGVQEHIDALVKKGMISKNRYNARGIELKKNREIIELPLLGIIAAGGPIEAIEDMETIEVPHALIPRTNKKYFALKVRGDSMIDDGILNGDVIVAEKTNTAQNGDLVVALTEDNEATLKYFYKEKNAIRLEPRNPAYESMYFKTIDIQGKFINLLRQAQRIEPDNIISKTVEREKLENEYKPLIKKRFDYRRLVTYVPNKKLPIFNWFPYKEGFSRDLVAGVLNDFNIKPGTYVLDPFGGCGTTALACKQLGYNSIGVDILPIAIFVATVKLKTKDDYDLDKLEKAINYITAKELGAPKTSLPIIPIINKAFPKQTQKELLFYKETILKVKDPQIRDFLLLGLLSILVDVSHTSKDGQYLRIVEKTIPPVQRVLKQKLETMFSDLQNGAIKEQSSIFERAKKKDIKLGDAKIVPGDARKLDLPSNKFSAVITSPPYLNRYDYSRIYALELGLNFVQNAEDLKRIRHELLRSHIEVRPAPTDDVQIPALLEILENLNNKELNNPRIPIMIKGYFEDMKLSIEEMYRVCKKGAIVALVVGNVRFEGEIVPVDLILTEVAKKTGFEPVDIWATRFKGNSSQQMGKYGRVPVRESIAFWKKI